MLRVINYQAGKRCKKSEKGISWAQGWTYKGLWRATTSYRPGDVVLDNGSSYVARAASLAKSPPSDASRWGLLASPGPQGATGATGSARPVRRAARTGRTDAAVGRPAYDDAALAALSGRAPSRSRRLQSCDDDIRAPHGPPPAAGRHPGRRSGRVAGSAERRRRRVERAQPDGCAHAHDGLGRLNCSAREPRRRATWSLRASSRSRSGSRHHGAVRTPGCRPDATGG